MSETWTAIAGYTTADYTDTMVFEVDYDSKKLQKISGQTLVAGEVSIHSPLRGETAKNYKQ